MPEYETHTTNQPAPEPRIVKRRFVERMEADRWARRKAAEHDEQAPYCDSVHPLFHLYPTAQAYEHRSLITEGRIPEDSNYQETELWGRDGDRRASETWIRVGLFRNLGEIASYYDDLDGLYERVVGKSDIEIFRQSVIVLRNPKQIPLKPTWIIEGRDGLTYVGLALAWPVRVYSLDRNSRGGLLALAEHMLGTWFQADTVAQGAGVWMPNPWHTPGILTNPDNIRELNPRTEYMLTELIELAKAAGIPADTNRIGISKGSFGPASFMFAVRYAGYRWVQRAYPEVFEFIPSTCVGAHVDIILRWYRKHHSDHDLLPKELLPVFACMAAYRILGPKGLNPIPDPSQDEKSPQTTREEATEASSGDIEDRHPQDPTIRQLILGLSEYVPDVVAEHLGRHYMASTLTQALARIELSVELMEGYSLPDLSNLGMDDDDAQLVYDALNRETDEVLRERIEAIERRRTQAAEREMRRARWYELGLSVDLDWVEEVTEEHRDDPETMIEYLDIIAERDEETLREIMAYVREVLGVEVHIRPEIYAWDMESLRGYDARRLFIRAEPMWLYRQVAERRGILRKNMSYRRSIKRKGQQRARWFFVLRGFVTHPSFLCPKDKYLSLLDGIYRGPPFSGMVGPPELWTAAAKFVRNLAGKVNRGSSEKVNGFPDIPSARRALKGLYQDLLV